jgi:hypothetical protein
VADLLVDIGVCEARAMCELKGYQKRILDQGSLATFELLQLLLINEERNPSRLRKKRSRASKAYPSG